jgi:hypothetical protein
MAGWTAAAIVGSTLIGANASKNAAQTQADAANRAADLQNAQYQQTRQDLAPWRTAGETALNKLVPLATDYTPFGMDQFKADPGYAFRLQEGLKQLGHAAGSRGGLISGQTLKATQDYAQNSASNEYTNAFNRYQAERQARLAPLQSLAGVGQTTATQLGQAGAANANAVGNYLTGGAAANAAGMVGGANAVASGLGTYLGYTGNNNLVNALSNRNLVNQYGSGNVYTPQGGGNTNLSWNGLE